MYYFSQQSINKFVKYVFSLSFIVGLVRDASRFFLSFVFATKNLQSFRCWNDEMFYEWD